MQNSNGDSEKTFPPTRPPALPPIGNHFIVFLCEWGVWQANGANINTDVYLSCFQLEKLIYYTYCSVLCFFSLHSLETFPYWFVNSTTFFSFFLKKYLGSISFFGCFLNCLTSLLLRNIGVFPIFSWWKQNCNESSHTSFCTCVGISIKWILRSRVVGAKHLVFGGFASCDPVSLPRGCTNVRSTSNLWSADLIQSFIS